MVRMLMSLLTAAALLVGCTTPYSPPKIVAADGQDNRFLGIVDRLERDRPLDVLIVHGMCTTDAKWAADSVGALLKALGSESVPGDLRPRPIEPNGITVYQQTVSLPRGALRINAIVWSPLTTPLKRQLCYDQTEKSATCRSAADPSPYPFRRAAFNGHYKDTLLDDCLSDVLIYQGLARKQISDKLQQAILVALATGDGQGRPTDIRQTVAAIPVTQPLVIITESLGSKMVFDALAMVTMSNTRDGTAAAATRTFSRVAQIFMYANQIPILGLADQGLDRPQVNITDASAGRFPPDPLRALLLAENSQPLVYADSVPKQIVAFTDPNDLLSYTLVASPFGPLQGGSTFDVAVSNKTTYFGQIESPLTHTAYPTNADVAALVACGSRRSGRCP